jgi:hypothetical protein
LGHLEGRESLKMKNEGSSNEGALQDTENLFFKTSANQMYVVQQLSDGKLDIYKGNSSDNPDLIQTNIASDQFILTTKGGRKQKYRKTKRNKKSKRFTRRK